MKKRLITIAIAITVFILGCRTNVAIGKYEGSGINWDYSINVKADNRFEFDWRAGLATGVTEGIWETGEDGNLYLTSDAQKSDSNSFEWQYKHFRYWYFNHEMIELEAGHLLFHKDSISQILRYRLKKK